MKLSESFDKKYLGRVAAFVLGIAAAVAILLYAGSHFVKRFSDGLELVDARLTTVTETIRADAYILRDETPVFSSHSDGSVVPEVHDGAHIHSGEIIATVYSEASPEVEERLAEIDEQIALFEKNREETLSVQSTSGIEKEIYSTITSMRESAENGDYADELSMRTSLLIGIKKRAILTGEITDYDAQIDRLEKEKDQLRTELGACLETVGAGHTGYYYSGYDGYGKVFDPAKIDSMTCADFDEMISSEPGNTSGAVGVTVGDYNWYIACKVKRTEAGVLENMGKCSVTFMYSGVNITMTLERVITEAGGENAVVVLRSGKMPTGFDYTRMQPVEISARSYTGFKLPKSAVRVLDGYEGVYVMDEVTIAFRRIEIIYDDGTDIICRGGGDRDKSGDDIVIINENADTSGITDGEKTEYGFIKQNDIVVVSGTELYSGKVIS